MPKELKKRQRGGRSKKKSDHEQQDGQNIQSQVESSNTEFHEQDFVPLGDTPKAEIPRLSGPSGSHSAGNALQLGEGEVDPAAPFGFVDPDIKAYFRSVDERLREWEALGISQGDDSESELEDRTSFLHSSLSELRSLELKLSTDQDCALIMERLLHSMGDWGRRVVADSFAGHWNVLIQHRFGSHVCQTLFSLAADAIDREAKGIFPKQHKEQEETLKQNPQIGTLRTMTQLVKDLTEELLKNVSNLLISTFASPALRTLMLLLSPGRAVPSTKGSSLDDKRIRSKKSAKFRNAQAGQMTSVIVNENEDPSLVGHGKKSERTVPLELQNMRKRILQHLKKRLSPVEWRAMGVENVGGPTIQVLLECDTDEGHSNEAGSILDSLTSGLVGEQTSASPPEPKGDDFFPSLFRDATGSHLAQTILRVAPSNIFDILWRIHFVGKIGKLSTHPIGNFVVATGVKRLDEEALRNVIDELRAVDASTLIRSAKTSVLQALVSRSGETGYLRGEISSSYQKAIRISKGEEEENAAEPEEAEEPETQQHGWKPRQPRRQTGGTLDPTMQGALLLQDIIAAGKGLNETVLDSLTSLSAEELLVMAFSPISSHILDAALTSPGVEFKWRRKLLMAFMGHYLELAQDKLGSRVADTIWDKAADGFTREKIARSLIDHHSTLSQSQYGKYFAKKLNLPLLQRRPAEWKEVQLGVIHHFNGSRLQGRAEAGSKSQHETDAGEVTTKKRKLKTDDETAVIDSLFADVTKEKKSKKSKI
ncbi:hypothetical protein QFC19_006818 [Naganishia cerealis]|uniref:Uncharacterized protein n=1 Tax=Naganishia cerealis TaxID=610337 RepID=A0ACC2VEI8_9TREE|nr:hypothetical protein QFC19_006818 [Naganishia cerealis]